MFHYDKKMSKVRVAAIVVTYNRKDLLARCLNAIQKQSFKPYYVFIVDNASTDGTDIKLAELGLKNMDCSSVSDVIVNGQTFVYRKLPVNVGGAGGFYEGMKIAYEKADVDLFWVMDDDGEPDEECLIQLVKHSSKFDYLSPIVVSDIDKGKLAFPSEKYVNVDDIIKISSKDDLIYGLAYPFNGVLYSRRLVADVGFPHKDFFIWGDEINYQLRAKEKGYEPVAVVKAIHSHPLRKVSLKCFNLLLKQIYIPDIDDKLRLYCYARNYTYNDIYLNHAYGKVVVLWFIWNFMFLRKGEFDRISVFNLAFKDGIIKNFSDHTKYLK